MFIPCGFFNGFSGFLLPITNMIVSELAILIVWISVCMCTLYKVFTDSSWPWSDLITDEQTNNWGTIEQLLTLVRYIYILIQFISKPSGIWWDLMAIWLNRKKCKAQKSSFKNTITAYPSQGHREPGALPRFPTHSHNTDNVL